MAFEFRRADGVVTVDRENTEPETECTGCAWHRWDLTTFDAARKAAHRHVAETGHRAIASERIAITYGPQAKPEVHKVGRGPR